MAMKDRSCSTKGTFTAGFGGKFQFSALDQLAGRASAEPEDAEVELPRRGRARKHVGLDLPPTVARRAGQVPSAIAWYSCASAVASSRE
jgi:hypothetical protein